MQVTWDLLMTIAKTKAIDLWLLFPLGVAVNRLVTGGEPPPAWARALSRTFGTDEWRQRFYAPDPQLTLFGADSGQKRTTSIKKIADFFFERLTTIFPVASKPLTLLNSTNCPLYLLCFVAGNPKKAELAVRIANDIIGRS